MWGTLSVLDAAAAAGVTHFVNISTDKAANSGQRARLLEAGGRGAHVALRPELPGHATSACGSATCSAAGARCSPRSGPSSTPANPLTVTHPDVTRYFMTIEEAVQLVIQAGAIGSDGHALVLDMGEPVRIYDVARQLAVEPRRPELPIVFTGLRPGEKLHEDLFCDRRDRDPERPRAHPLRGRPRWSRVRDLDPTAAATTCSTSSGSPARSTTTSRRRPVTVDIVITERLDEARTSTRPSTTAGRPSCDRPSVDRASDLVRRHRARRDAASPC